MKKFLQVLTIVTLGLATFFISIQTGAAAWLDGQRIHIPAIPILSFQPQVVSASDLLSSACALKPLPKPKKLRRLPSVRSQLPLDRFRREIDQAATKDEKTPTPSYTPKEEIALAHPTNFGRRFIQDLYGESVNNKAIVVLHETVGSARSTIRYFQTPHPRDDDQVSYHTLIKEDGTIVYVVPPERRAFGAGNSVFRGDRGIEAVKTNPDFPPSVNNFAYHISLVTPPDGRGNGNSHSGYTRAQYQSLAWLVAKTGIPDSRVTTHRLVDRSRQRKDPRSFDFKLFSTLLSSYPKALDVPLQCTTPVLAQEE